MRTPSSKIVKRPNGPQNSWMNRPDTIQHWNSHRSVVRMLGHVQVFQRDYINFVTFREQADQTSDLIYVSKYTVSRLKDSELALKRHEFRDFGDVNVLPTAATKISTTK